MRLECARTVPGCTLILLLRAGLAIGTVVLPTSGSRSRRRVTALVLRARQVVWRREYKDPNTGIEHNFGFIPSLRPALERDDAGTIKKAIFASRPAPQRLIHSLPYLKYRFTEQTLPELNLSSRTFDFHVGSELRRLCIKMCVAAR